MKSRLILIITFITCCVTAQNNAIFPFQNPDLKRDERVNNLLKQLTAEEKIGLMMNRSLAVQRLGIPEYDWWNEALHGVARAGYATVFPQAIAMAATFNDADHYNTFSMISDEARAKYHKAISEGNRQIFYGLTFWTPNINIFRDPRWGRGMETYGEDPYLTSRFGVNAVKGLQGNDLQYFKTLACAKHFAVHSGPEWNRHSYNAQVSDKDLWETYLPAFESLVKESNVQQVMCAYNRFEDSPCCGSGKLLIDILRNKWNYKGLVVSDCWAIDDFYKPGHHETHSDSASASIAAVLNGTDIECGRSYESLIKALKLGLIKESDIDISVKRVLTARYDMGMFDADSRVKWSGIPYNVVDCPLHKAQALKVAHESMTLLKNNNNVLPLSKKLKTIAVIGANANDSVMMWANYNGYPTSTTTILKGIRDKMPNSKIIYEKGCDLVDKTVKNSLMNCLKANGKKGMYAEYYNNIKWEGTPAFKTNGVEQFNFSTSGGTQFAPNVNLENFTARYTGEFIAPYTGKINFSLKADDSYRLILNGKCVMEAPNYEKAMNKLVYSAEFKKGEKVQVQLDYLQLNLNGNLNFQIYSEKTVEFSELKNNIKNADVIIYVGGLSAQLEGEDMPVKIDGFKGGDRTRIELPYVQQELLKELRSTGKPVVFVLCTGSAIALTNDEPNYDALLNAWYGGQAGGTAVANVLFGDYNPAGRLPITFYKSTSQLPDFEDYNMNNRTYRFFKDVPLYAFGYGLSYTNFKYGKATLHSANIKKGDSVKLIINVSNIGKRDGDEVIQIYIHHKNTSAEPIKALKAFRRINLKAGASKQIDFELNADAFKTFDATKSEMNVSSGEYEIMIGSSSLEKDLQKISLKIE
jgi:beta-glucosidase